MSVADAAATLGVGVDADQVEIDRRFRAIVKASHPDLGADGAPEDLARAVAARSVLRAAAIAAASRRGIDPVRPAEPRSPYVHRTPYAAVPADRTGCIIDLRG